MEDNSDIPFLSLHATKRERRSAFSFPDESSRDFTEFRALNARQLAQDEAIIDDPDEIREALKVQIMPEHDSGMLECDSSLRQRT